MSDGSVYPRPYAHPPVARPSRAAEVENEARRSNAAIPVAVVVVVVGLVLGRYTFLLPGILGLILLFVTFSFLSTRLNPLSPHFYLTRKPSWPAVAAVFLGALLLLWDAYSLLTAQFGPVLSHL